jgi:hypothetical protein
MKKIARTAEGAMIDKKTDDLLSNLLELFMPSIISSPIIQ